MYNEGIPTRVENLNRKKFFVIDNEIVMDDRLDGYDLAVYSGLAFHENQSTGLCNPSYNTISKYLGFSRDRIMKSLKKLQEYKYLSVVPTAGTSNHYVLNDVKFVYSEYMTLKSTTIDSRNTEPQTDGLQRPVQSSCGGLQRPEGLVQT